MLKLFGEIFSKRFWKNAGLVATFYDYSTYQMNLRAKKQQTEEKWETKQNEKMALTIPYLKNVSSFSKIHKYRDTYKKKWTFNFSNP